MQLWTTSACQISEDPNALLGSQVTFWELKNVNLDKNCRNLDGSSGVIQV